MEHKKEMALSRAGLLLMVMGCEMISYGLGGTGYKLHSFPLNYFACFALGSLPWAVLIVAFVLIARAEAKKQEAKK